MKNRRAKQRQMRSRGDDEEGEKSFNKKGKYKMDSGRSKVKGEQGSVRMRALDRFHVQ